MLVGTLDDVEQAGAGRVKGLPCDTQNMADKLAHKIRPNLGHSFWFRSSKSAHWQRNRMNY
ncbi:MAG: hypothetical protein P4L10_07060 [Acidobacteriaceae bacterium]|nr:hypothetical protein [Acidobacteriaceae bacterium]